MDLLQPDFSVFDSKKKLKFPLKINSELCEFVGLHIGDGHLAFHKDQKEYIFQISGHPIKDKVFYDNFVAPLVRELFNLNIIPRVLSNETYGFQIYSKALFLFLIKNFGLPDGKKARIVSIPKVFKRKEYLIGCLRGIIDSDFYISFDRKSAILGGWFASKALVTDLEKSFNSLGINCRCQYDSSYFDKRTGKRYKRHHIRVSKKEDFKKWFQIIGTNHPVLFLKYQNWLKCNFLTDKYILK